jgi:hypothetical protein
MPRYYFDTTADKKTIVDDVGSDLPGREAARELALAGLRDLARDHGPTEQLSVTVREEGGAVVYRATLSLAESRIEDGEAPPD